MSVGRATGPAGSGDRAKSFSLFVEDRFVLIAGIFIAAGTLFRLALIWATTSPSNPYNLLYPGYGDGARYVNIARSILETGTFGYAGRPTAFRSPAYPAIIALTWKTLGVTLTPVRILQVGIFVLMAIVYARVVTDRFGRLAGAITVALMSLHPMFVFMSTEIATESLYMLLESFIFALTLTLLERDLPSARRTWVSLCAGVCCGAGALTRPNMFLVFLTVAALIAWQGIRNREGWRKWGASVVALVLGNYLVLGPWLIRNERTVGAPVLATNIEYNLFRGTFDVVGAIPFGPVGEDIMVARFRDHHVMYEGEIEDVRKTRLPFGEVLNEEKARAEALAFIRSNPSGWFWERIRNAAYLWLNLQWEAPRLQNPVVMLASVLVTFLY